MANFLKISHKILKEMDFSLKNSIFISKKSGKLIKMQQFNQIFNFLFFVPNFLQKIKKFIKSKKQKFFVFVGSHIHTVKNSAGFSIQYIHFFNSCRLQSINFLNQYLYTSKKLFVYRNKARSSTTFLEI